MEESDRKLFEAFFQKQTDKFEHRMDVLMDHFDHKIDLVVEGQQMLAERLDRVEHELKEEISKVDQRLTGLSADLSAHRADTEAHHGIYRVKEN